MSKEEILLRNGFDILENGCVYTDKHRVERAMNEWAAQESRIETIAFAEWMQRYTLYETNPVCKFITRQQPNGSARSKPETFTTEQLYQLFLKSK